MLLSRLRTARLLSDLEAIISFTASDLTEERGITRVIKRRAKTLLEALEAGREYYTPSVEDIIATDWIVIDNAIRVDTER